MTINLDYRTTRQVRALINSKFHRKFQQNHHIMTKKSRGGAKDLCHNSCLASKFVFFIEIAKFFKKFVTEPF